MLLPVDAARKTNFALFGTNDSVLGPWGTFAKTKLNAKTAAVVYPQVPGIDVGAKVEKTSLTDAGISTKLVGFDANATDLTGPLTAAGAQTADIANLSRWAFLFTFAGVGLKTNFVELRRQGWRPLVVGVVGECAIAAITLLVVLAVASRL